jgi:maleate cis-trans isomerase
MQLETMMSQHGAVLAVPANNTSMEPEMNALCPQAAPFAVARVPVPHEGLNLGNLAAYSKTTLESVDPFLSDAPKLIVHGCTAAGFLAGPRATAEMVEALRRKSGAVVVSTGASMVDVLRHEGVSETAVVTPYLKPVNDGLRRYLADAGIGVEVLDSFECQTIDELGAVTREQVMELALKTVTPQSKSLFIACSQLPTLGIIEPLRERLGIPVWSSISATAWAASRALADNDTQVPA